MTDTNKQELKQVTAQQLERMYREGCNWQTIRNTIIGRHEAIQNQQGTLVIKATPASEWNGEQYYLQKIRNTYWSVNDTLAPSNNGDGFIYVLPAIAEKVSK